MIKPAQLYKDKLQEEYIKIWYDKDCVYYYGSQYIILPDNIYNKYSFVSVDKDNNIIGYISYSIDWIAKSASNFGVINFKKDNLEFFEDIYKIIYDLFEVYHINRISWFVSIDNPAIKEYRNFIKSHGGRECAYKQITKLLDGKLHDAVEFEILAEEFHK